jgi:lipoprotein LprG
MDNMSRFDKFRLIILLTLFLLLAGCGKAGLKDLPVSEIVKLSSERMTTLSGFEFIIDRSGEPVFLDGNDTISFKRAEGQFNAPDRVYANVRLITPGLVTEVQIISIAGTQWETNFLTGNWQNADPLYSFNPSIIFDPNHGIQSILANDLVDPVLSGMDEIDELPGRELYLVEASVEGSRPHEMSLGLIDDETLQVKLWIDPDTYDLHRILIVDPKNPDQSEDTNWQIDFWNFDANFEIEPPAIDQ